MVLLQTSEKNTETSVIRKADLGKAGTNMELIEIGCRAKEASFLLGKMGSQEKNEGLLAAADAILAGQETMTVAVDGYDVGYLGVQAAVDALNGKTLEKFIATDATVVTAENAAERRAEVEKRLGTS